MIDFFASEVMRTALLPALLIAITASSISVMVLAHRLSFLTVGVSHATLAGLGLAVTFSLPLLPTASATAVAVALLLAPMLWKRGLNEDAATGVLFAGAMALGIVLISRANRYEVDLFGLLFGNILIVSDADRHWLILAAGIIMLCFLWGARGWWSIAFDAPAAAASGLPVTFYRMLLYAVTGLTVVMCVKLAGLVLTTGLLVLPAACAWFWGKGLGGLWLLSMAFSITGTLIGLMISYAEDWPSGATVVLTLCMMFLISWGGAQLVQNSPSRNRSA